MTQKQVDEWNATFPVGSPCIVRYATGTEHSHHTRSEAWLLMGGQPVVLIDELCGAYPLDRVKMVETHTPEPPKPAVPSLEALMKAFDDVKQRLVAELEESNRIIRADADQIQRLGEEVKQLRSLRLSCRLALDELLAIISDADKRGLQVNQAGDVRWMLELPMTEPEYRRWVELTGWRKSDGRPQERV